MPPRAIMTAIWAVAVGTLVTTLPAVLPATGETSRESHRSPAREPYRSLADAGAGYCGPGREEAAPEGLTTVRLGVFGPARDSTGRGLLEGIQLALEEANGRGGYRGLPYEMVFRADDGPWGMGAKQVAALAYEDSVWAVLGGLEGGGAHLAELVAAKAWVPVVTPAAADLTIDYANVPWVFRCFPSDAHQARCLLDYACQQNWKRLIVFVTTDRAGRCGLARLRREAQHPHCPRLDVQEFDARDLRTPLQLAGLSSADGVVIWSQAEGGVALLRALRRDGYAGPVLGPAQLLSPEMSSLAAGLGEVVIAAPYDLSRRDERIETFRTNYRERFARSPEPVALFAYDAAGMLIAAIETAGLNRARIRDALAARPFAGVTGTIRFDGLGGAKVEPILMRAGERGWGRVSFMERVDEG